MSRTPPGRTTTPSYAIPADPSPARTRSRTSVRHPGERLFTISATVEGSHWTDFNGHYGDDPSYSAGFASAAGNVTSMGLSFGGECFFENGVGTTDGSGTFTLASFSAS